MNIVLASSSPYRSRLLMRTGLQFATFAPDVAEAEITRRLLNEGKSPEEVAENLAIEKAKKAAEKFPGALIIAGDQLVSFNGILLGKPLNFETAFNQLQGLRGHTHQLVTAMALLSNSRLETFVEVTQLKMKSLTDAELANYLLRDKPFDCAGSYKIEESGIVLFESVETSDFSAIQGIPMIWLSNRLKEYGYEFFQNPAD